MSAQHILDADDRIHVPAGSKVPDGLLAAFWNYERALMSNDLESLDTLFAAGPDTSVVMRVVSFSGTTQSAHFVGDAAGLRHVLFSPLK